MAEVRMSRHIDGKQVMLNSHMQDAYGKERSYGTGHARSARWSVNSARRFVSVGRRPLRKLVRQLFWVGVACRTEPTEDAPSGKPAAELWPSGTRGTRPLQVAVLDFADLGAKLEFRSKWR